MPNLRSIKQEVLKEWKEKYPAESYVRTGEFEEQLSSSLDTLAREMGGGGEVTRKGSN